MLNRARWLPILIASLTLALSGCDDDTPTSDGPDARVGATPDAGTPGGDQGTPPGEVQLTVTEPADGAIQSALAVRVAGTVTAGAGVTVNGRAANVTGTEWQITLDLPGEGPHELVTEAGAQRDTRTVVIDQTPPRIDFRNPTRAQWLQADTVDLALTATDGQSFLSALTLGGIELDPANGPDFNLNAQPLQPGVTLYQATATDAAGNQISEHAAVMQGPQRDPAERVGGALRIQLGTAAIDALERVAVRLIGEQDLASLLPNPLLESPARISVTDAEWQTLTVDLTPVPGQLDLVVEFGAVGITVEIQVGQNAPSLPVVVGVERIRVTGALIPRIVDGRLSAEIPEDQLNVELVGLMLALDQVPDFGDPDQEANLLEQTIAAALNFAISEQIPGALDGLLGRLDEPFEFTALGATLRLVLAPEVLVVNQAGLGVRVGVDVQLVGEPNPPADLPGYLTTPSAWNGVPETDQLGLAIDDDLLNALLFQFWRSGVLLPVIDDAFIAGGGAELGLLRNLLRSIASDADPTVTNQTPIAAVTRLPLPIAVRVRKGADDRIGLQLGIAGLELNLRTDDAEARPLLDGSATLLAEGDLGVSQGEGGTLGLDLSLDQFTTAFDVTTEALRGAREASIEDRTVNLLSAVGGILPGLLDGLSLPSIDLVQLGEITVGVAPQDPNFIVLDIAIAE